jgi:hypothetical protein
VDARHLSSSCALQGGALPRTYTVCTRCARSTVTPPVAPPTTTTAGTTTSTSATTTTSGPVTTPAALAAPGVAPLVLPGVTSPSALPGTPSAIPRARSRLSEATTMMEGLRVDTAAGGALGSAGPTGGRDSPGLVRSGSVAQLHNPGTPAPGQSGEGAAGKCKCK